MILDELLAIPADATNATVQGVEMQIISADQADKMLVEDANDENHSRVVLLSPPSKWLATLTSWQETSQLVSPTNRLVSSSADYKL